MSTIRRLVPANILHKLKVVREAVRENRELLDVVATRLPAADRVWTPLADRLIPRPLPEPDDYERWCQAFLDGQDLDSIRAFCATLAVQPIISIVVAVHRPKLSVLAEAIDSVKAQAYPNWQLCLVDDSSRDTELTHLLACEALSDPRIDLQVRPKRGNVVATQNDAIALAYGEYVTFLDHDDLLPPDALAWVVAYLNRYTSARLLYTDDDQLNAQGERVNPYFKPDWDPELLLGQNYLNHLLVIERATLKLLGGLREGTDGVQDWDLALRASELLSGNEIVHVPAIGYHWRNPPESKRPLSTIPATLEAATQVVSDAMGRRGIIGTIEPLNALMRGIHRTPTAYPPVLTVILPCDESLQIDAGKRQKPRHTIDELASTISGILSASYPNQHIVILVRDDDPAHKALVATAIDEISNHPWPDAASPGNQVELVEYHSDTTIGLVLNSLVEHCNADYVCVFSGASRPMNATWLHEMVGLASSGDVGAVGGLVTYPSAGIHNAGVAIGIGGEFAFRYHRDPSLSTGHRDRLLVNQSVGGVTGAALVVNRERYLEVGGFDSYISRELADIDLCLRLAAIGYRCCFTPTARFVRHLDPVEEPQRNHLETNRDRGADRNDATSARSIQGEEHRRFSDRWGSLIGRDPYYNPNLSTEAATFFPGVPAPFAPPWSHPVYWRELPMANPERFYTTRWRRLEPESALAIHLSLEGVAQLRLWIDCEEQSSCRIDLVDAHDEVVTSFFLHNASSLPATAQLRLSQHGDQAYKLINRGAQATSIMMVRLDEHNEIPRIGLGRLV